MTKLSWNTVGERYYEAGVDRGVLYTQNGPGVAWNGLVAVTQSPSGSEASPHYADGIKYLNLLSAEEFGGSIEAYTYPEEFEECDGTISTGGVSIGQQPRKPFSLSYRTRLGNDVDGIDYGYRIHLIYNALASPSERSYATLNDSPEAMTFTWDITTTPVPVKGLKPTSHITFDSNKTHPKLLAHIEQRLYGTEDREPELIYPEEILKLISEWPTLKVVDNGDGTWTATGTQYEIRMLEETEFEINSATAIPIDAVSYRLSSAED